MTVPESLAEVVGAVLMEWLGPFEVETPSAASGVAPAGVTQAPRAGESPAEVTLLFYPQIEAAPGAPEVLQALPEELGAGGQVRVALREVPRDWVEGWRDHFQPIVLGKVRIRPPWEARLEGGALVDVAINPGLGFGTGLHPTTRGVLHLLQNAGKPDRPGNRLLGPLVDAGTGSGILAIAAAKLGWGPVFAFDNDPVALVSARENVEANGVEGVVEVHHVDVAGASASWFAGATVLANMTLEPVLALVRRFGPRQSERSGGIVPIEGPVRLVVSGILEGAQERELQGVVSLCGFIPGRRVQEAEWVSLELLPSRVPAPAGPRPSSIVGS